MTNEKKFYSNIISLILHIVAVWAVINIRSTHIITPSRSDGIEVTVIAKEYISETIKPVINPTKPKIIPTINTKAEVNIKQESITKVISPTKPLEQKQVLEKKSTQKQNPKKQPNAELTNTILEQLSSTTKSGVSKGKTTGGTTTGTLNNNNMVNSYADLVISTVRPYVNIPENIDSKAKAIVKVILLPNMQVYQTKLIKSSGNSSYDNNVQQAINKVKVFPPIPENANWIEYKVLYLSFTPE